MKKSVNDHGIIISDKVQEGKVRQLMRKMKGYNPTSSHFDGIFSNTTDNIIEYLFMRDSKHSYFVQTEDVIAQALFRKEFPKGSLKKHYVEKYFNYLKPVCLREASKKDDLGIVR